jgi:hypothetical protein
MAGVAEPGCSVGTTCAIRVVGVQVRVDDVIDLAGSDAEGP